MTRTSMLAVAISFALCGCMTDRTKSLFNPPPVHPAADQSTDYAKYGEIPIRQYYEALDVAKEKDKAKDNAAVGELVDKGIGLVSAYCLRWFQRIDDAQRRLAMQQKDFNIIRDLGTALLGIGGANQTIVASYGALNTAYTGIVENFNEAVLAGPTTAKIKGQVLDMLKQSEDALRADVEEKKLTFAQAYSRIELHADTCTYNTVRNLLDSSLSSTKPTREPETGQITSEVVEYTRLIDDSSAKLRKYWRPDGKVNTGNEDTLKKWMSAHELGNVSIASFIRSAQLAQLRAKAVKDLNL